ncbi:hypothetical protein LIER_39910 [Lithospermum erythrorhizon]|uniref:Reverse transcriptase n=1 Tax=Lithospermum erythrorhizon TaxID=34254 RepID=A0AAV3QMY3_LITER
MVLKAFGFRREMFPIIYLGIPIYKGIKFCFLFDKLFTTIKERIAGWRDHLLRLGEGLPSFKSILSTLPTYYMQALMLPTCVTQNLKKIFELFFAEWQTLGHLKKEDETLSIPQIYIHYGAQDVLTWKTTADGTFSLFDPYEEVREQVNLIPMDAILKRWGLNIAFRILSRIVSIITLLDKITLLQLKHWKGDMRVAVQHEGLSEMNRVEVDYTILDSNVLSMMYHVAKLLQNMGASITNIWREQNGTLVFLVLGIPSQNLNTLL